MTQLSVASVAVPGLAILVRGRPHAEEPALIYGAPRQLVAEVLVRARAEICNPNRWMQGAAGMTSYGLEVLDPKELWIYPERQIVKMCSDGAIGWAAFWIVPPTSAVRLDDVINAAEHVFHAAAGQDIAAWNDAVGRTHGEVISMFDRAIASVLAA